MLRFVVFLALSVGAEAACSNPSTGLYKCPDTGDATTNGTDLFDLLNNNTFPCGSKVVLDAGVEYIGHTTEPYRMKDKPTCTAAQPTRITSTRCSEVSGRVQPADLPKLAKLSTRSTTSSGVIGMYAYASNWIWECVAMTTAQSMVDVQRNVSALIYPIYEPQLFAYRNKNVTFDRVLIYPREEELYGDANINNHDGRAFFRTITTPFFSMTTQGLTIKNSYIYGFSGYVRSTQVTFTSISNANPAVVTGTGISAAIGLTPGTYTGICTADFAAAGGCRRMGFIGATGNWSALGTPKYLKYLTADTVAVYSTTTGCFYCATSTEAFDSTSMGALTGTVTLYKANISTQYPFYALMAYDTKILNSHFEGWGMNIFLGGGDPEIFSSSPAAGSQIDPAILQSGSTTTSWVLDHVRELKVGDLAVVKVPGAPMSTHCVSSSAGCGNGGKRTGKVTAINGNTVTLESYGPDGIDSQALTVGQPVMWRGKEINGFQIRRSTIFRNRLHPMADAGKGYIEVKQCVNCLFDGILTNDHTSGNAFVTTRNQAGYAVWAKSENVRFSNIVAQGDGGPWIRPALFNTDDEHSNLPGRNVVFEHIIAPGTSNTIAAALIDGSGLFDSGWRHYTIFANDGSTVRAFQHGDCRTSPSLYINSGKVIYEDNIVSFGQSINRQSGNPSCWPSYATDVRNNLFIDTAALGTSTITTAWPNNSAVANTTGLFAGTCNATGENWKNCSLDTGSAYRGTASDGGDPGADVQQVNDRINGWSEDAGLLEASVSPPGMFPKAGNWQIGSTSAAMTFRLFESIGENCTVELFIVRNRTGPHDDSAPGICDRTGSAVNGNTITYVFGTVSPLAPSTTYFYRINDGSTRKLVGEFTTLPAGSGISRTWSRAMECGPDTNFGTSVAAGTSYSMSSGDVRYCRESSPVGPTKVLVAR